MFLSVSAKHSRILFPAQALGLYKPDLMVICNWKSLKAVHFTVLSKCAKNSKSEPENFSMIEIIEIDFLIVELMSTLRALLLNAYIPSD